MKKKFVIVLLTLIIASTVYTKWFKQTAPQPVEYKSSIARIIDKQAVIRSLDQKGELVGMEGHLTKEMEYKEADFWGSKNYTLNADVTFKMGYDLDLVKRNMRIEGNTIYVTSIPTKLIAFEMPYDEVNIDKKVKWFHKSLKAEDIQMLYKALRLQAKIDIASDKKINAKATELTQQTLKDFLMAIPNVDNVIFVNVGAHNG